MKFPDDGEGNCMGDTTSDVIIELLNRVGSSEGDGFMEMTLDHEFKNMVLLGRKTYYGFHETVGERNQRFLEKGVASVRSDRI